MDFEKKLDEMDKEVDLLVSQYNVKDDEFKRKISVLKRDLIEYQISYIKKI